jgi:hypothetical protein
MARMLLKDSARQRQTEAQKLASFHELKEIVRVRNEVTKVALECSAFLFQRAWELPQDQRRSMLELVKRLITLENDQSGLTT